MFGMFYHWDIHYSKKKPVITDLEKLIPYEYFPKQRLAQGVSLNDPALVSKRIFEIIFAGTFLFLLSPLFLLIGLLIKLDSKGSVFFKQERVGKEGITFNMIKFRTMDHDAEAVKKRLMSQNEASGPVFKIKNDPRITRVGRILRKMGLDELPQLWNILKGDMSLIGPRPPLEDEVRQYEEWQFRRLSVRPGLTCTWQIVPNRHAVSFDEWAQMDLDYIDSWNLKKDVSIFFSTLKTFVSAGGH